MFVNNFSLFVEKKSCRQIAWPSPIHQVDCRLGIRNVQQVSRHSCIHRIEKLGHAGFDLTEIVERDSHKLQRMRPEVLVDLHEIRKLFTAGITKRGPEVNE